jgi:hypothetical protein
LRFTGFIILSLLIPLIGFSNSHFLKNQLPSHSSILPERAILSNEENRIEHLFKQNPPNTIHFYAQGSNTSQTDTLKKKQTLSRKQLATQPQIATSEIDGLLLNATFSPGGYDFYLALSHNWTPPINASGYTILVKEYQGRGVNIVVAVEVNDRQLVFRRMRPTYGQVQSLAVAVANYIHSYIARGDHIRGLDADGNFIDVQRSDITKQIKTPFDVY